MTITSGAGILLLELGRTHQMKGEVNVFVDKIATRAIDPCVPDQLNEFGVLVDGTGNHRCYDLCGIYATNALVFVRTDVA